ncbi:MAG: phosphatidylserine decarboxylase family protein [Bacteroidales bacterium]
MIRIHREGRLIVAITILVLLGLEILTGLYLPPLFDYLISALALLVLILVIRFFRVPVHHSFRDDTSIISPADGKVVAIEKIYQDEYLKKECLQVSVFMSIHDVHINYYPVSGTVQYLRYHPGKYLVARHPKSSILNERNSIGIATAWGPLLVRQIAGTVARRIKWYPSLKQKVQQGSEMGFIKFGSRLDLFIPLHAELKVGLNDRVMGGVTPIARIK